MPGILLLCVRIAQVVPTLLPPSTLVAILATSAPRAISKDPQAPCTLPWPQPCGLQEAHWLWL